MKQELLRSPLLLLTGAFAAGILVARPGHALIANLPLLVTSACFFHLAGLFMLRKARERAATACLLLGFMGAGAAATRLFEQRFPPDHVRHVEGRGVDLSDPVRLEGRVASSPLRAANELQFDLEVHRLAASGRDFPCQGKVRLRLLIGEDAESMALAESLGLAYGDRVRVLARLRKPRIYRNPGSVDFRRWLEAIEDVPYVGTIKSPHLLEKFPQAASPGLAGRIHNLRQRLLGEIDRLYPPWTVEGRYGAVLKAALLGDRSSLDSETVENFRRTGLYHQLVVSGLQLGLLAFLVGALLRLLRPSEGVQIVALLAAMLGYALLL